VAGDLEDAMLARLGRWVARWRFLVLVGWAVVALVGAVFGGAVYDRTQPVDNLRPDVESAVGQARLDEIAPHGETIVAVISGRDFFATELVDSATRIMHEIRAMPGVANVTDEYTRPAGRIAEGSRSSLVTVELKPELSDEDALALADRVAAALHRIDAPEVLVGGEILAEREFGEQAIADAVFGESIALVVLCVVLVVILGGLRAGLLPLLTALATIAGTLLALTGLASAMAVSEYAVNVVTLLGIGLAVDYSLLIIARFREERAAGPGSGPGGGHRAARGGGHRSGAGTAVAAGPAAPLADLIGRTMATAGRAVLVSGLAVGTALAGLFAFADPLLAAMALGGALVVILATAAGLTLVPALVAVTHRHIPNPGTRTWVWWRAAGHPRPRTSGVLARLAGFAQRHPAPVALAVTAGLIVLSLPLLGVNLGNSDARSLPAGSEARTTYETVERDFADDIVQPVTVVIEGDANEPSVQALIDRMKTLSSATDVTLRLGLPRGAAVVDLETTGTSIGEPAQRLVRDVRELDAAVPFRVVGPAAELVDARHSTAGRLPIAFAIIVIVTGFLLFALTGSVVVPVKALVMNVLTLTATFGVLVAVFQWGWGSGVLGFESWGALDLTTPLLLFVFVFGLSMDYEVFLLARIKEEWDARTAPERAANDRAANDRAANDRAVLAGITATGPVVTAAALSIGIVFLGFALGELVAVKEIGVGMTVAVLLDVTVVRGLLLPAVMSLLGRRNWWRPRFARRVVAAR
jgi:RND superfamily putative drug exporter